jgi:hypothetical protein
MMGNPPPRSFNETTFPRARSTIASDLGMTSRKSFVPKSWKRLIPIVLSSTPPRERFRIPRMTRGALVKSRDNGELDGWPFRDPRR